MTYIALILLVGMITYHWYFRKKVTLNQVNQTKEKLNHLSLLTEDAMLIIDTNRSIIKANPQATKVFGYEEEELVGKCIDDILIAGDLLTNENSSYIPLNEPLSNYGIYISHKKDSYYKAFTESKIIEVNDQKFAVLIIESADNLLVNQVHDSFKQFTIDKSTEAILWVNQNAGIVYVNNTAAKLMGRRVDEILQMKTAEICEELKDWKKVMSITEQYGDCVFEAAISNDKGDAVPVEMIVKHMGLHDSNYCCIYMKNISSRKIEDKIVIDYAAQLERKNEELEHFTYIAAHSLQEPVRMIGSFTQLLNERYKGNLDDEADEFITFVVDGVNKMQSLLRDLARYSNISMRPKSFQLIEAQEIARVSLEKLKFQMEEHNAIITYDNLPTIRGNQIQLLQLFRNLISNAIKYRRDIPPRIHISAEQTDLFWKFAIKDNGQGIEPNQADKIFHIFNRLQYITDYSEGTGMGLAICQKIVEKHGGQIWMESTPGMGTTFYFTLPIPAQNLYQKTA